VTILRRILKKQCVRILSGLNWLRIRSRGSGEHDNKFIDSSREDKFLD
jgi:hypothetical protein